MKIYLAFSWLGIFCIFTLQFILVLSAIIDNHDSHEVDPALQFQYHTENGQERYESVRYNKNAVDNDVTTNVDNNDNDSANNKNDKERNRSLEFRGDYSFISADGYRYTVKYKANKKGYLPYVTVEKVF